MKIISIGNSFSQDAQRYLHALAKHNGVKLKAVNLYIGGCTLRSHYINMLDESARLFNVAGYETPEAMMSDVRTSYKAAAKAIDADGMIPCGEAMLKASQTANIRVHRDGFHASLGVGRYLLALCWFRYLTGLDISSDSFEGFDSPVSDEERATVFDAVNYAIGDNR